MITPEKERIDQAIKKCTDIVEIHPPSDFVTIGRMDLFTLIACARIVSGQVPKWVSVEEELPEEHIHVLAYVSGDRFKAYYDEDAELWYLPDGEYGFDVECWMHLPSPPEQEVTP